MRRYVLGDVQSEYMFINGMWFLVSILYWHNVVVKVLQQIVVKYGARTHSARRYNAYTCKYNFKNGIIL